MSVVISDVDRGYRNVLANVRALRGGRMMRVGVTDAPHEGTPGMSVSDIGAIHEFGLGSAPQRSFLRAWVDKEQSNWLKRLRANVLAFVLSGTAWEAKFGQYCVDGIRTRIWENIPPALLDETVKRKAHEGLDTTPLVASGQLIAGVEYEVGPQ
jgi:hypothetical protein